MMNLYQYLLDVAELEKERYCLEGLISRLNSMINSLGNPRRIACERNAIYEGETRFDYVKIIVLLCAIGWGIFGLYCMSFGYATGTLFFIFIVPSIAFLVYVIRSTMKTRRAYEENERIISENYRRAEEEDAERVAYENQIAAYYADAKRTLMATHRKTKELLDKLYAFGVIYEKYRYDFVAICMFEEYFKSRRCTTLEGHEGAYNLYENELRMGLILNKLDEIIRRLDRIEQNQYGLYTALKEISHQQDQILSSLRNVSNNVSRQNKTLAHIQYDLEVTRRNTDLAAFYGINRL